MGASDPSEIDPALVPSLLELCGGWLSADPLARTITTITNAARTSRVGKAILVQNLRGLGTRRAGEWRFVCPPDMCLRCAERSRLVVLGTNVLLRAGS